MTESNISNLSKFRRLKQHATQANVSGLVKARVSSKKILIYHEELEDILMQIFRKKNPGVLVFEGERTAIKYFLENAKRTYVKFTIKRRDT